ncbi:MULTISPECIES: Rossmann-like and DUF2520 domain-containing protein [unclassified Acinetobacter]|uniref:Rossmann-like and DUF2520 domain-containing protein n=1 Tax=unclassified Acinetobacter TaxID=196816 RepID=UPI0015D418FD|nr:MULTISPECIES: DUF2520 domain-containing protein [unclassified Acinetobacter]
MRISIVGAGRVAHHLLKVLHPQHHIVQVYARNLEKAEKLAASVGAKAVDTPTKLNAEIDLLIIAVSDQSIATVIQQVTAYLPQVLIVHTSGSTNITVLTQQHLRAGVFYPLQTFSLDRDVDWTSTPIFVEAADSKDLRTLTDLANSMSQRVYQYDSAQRLSLHLAAVFACNFSNYCYDMAKQVVDAKYVDFSLLYPLILETANKATQAEPRNMQTGPAMRGDQNIMQMHANMLEQADQVDLKVVYEMLSQQIFEHHQK